MRLSFTEVSSLCSQLTTFGLQRTTFRTQSRSWSSLVWLRFWMQKVSRQCHRARKLMGADYILWLRDQTRLMFLCSSFFVYCVYILYYVYSLNSELFFYSVYIALFCYPAFWPQESVNKPLSLSLSNKPATHVITAVFSLSRNLPIVKLSFCPVRVCAARARGVSAARRPSDDCTRLTNAATRSTDVHAVQNSCHAHSDPAWNNTTHACSQCTVAPHVNAKVLFRTTCLFTRVFIAYWSDLKAMHASASEVTNRMAYVNSSSLLWMLACWWWWFDCSFVRLTAPAVTTTSIILCFNKHRPT